jgi:hypothetical protein
MHHVILAEHTAEACPTSNSKIKALMAEIGPQIPKIAEDNDVKIVAGPFVTREHVSVVIVEADRSESLDNFVAQSRLAQWNRVRVMPSHHIQEAMEDFAEAPSLF